jgi:flagellar motor switch protein FliN/FliY
VSLSIIIELGRTETSIDNLLEWSEGSLIELDKVSGEAVDVYINGKPFAQGEVVTVAENFGVRLTEILPHHSG